MTRTVTVALLLAALGCAAGDRLELAVIDRCEVDNGVYRLAIERLSDGTLACEAESLKDPRPAYQAKDCAGPEPCDCAAVHGEMTWDFSWPDDGAPEAECYPADATWMPCGCATRLEFDAGCS